MSRKKDNILKNILDESAFLASGAGVAYSASQYASMRKDLFRQYTKNAWKVSGKKFSRKGYSRFMEGYLKKINRLRTSPKTYRKGEALVTDLSHFRPTYISKRSRKLIKDKDIQRLIKMNKRTFRKIAPKRTALFAAGLATAATLPALAYRAQGKKDWKKSIKESSLQLAGPTLAVLGAYGYYRFGKYGKLLPK